MRFTDATRDILTRIRAKPSKIELINLLTQITNDRLESIIRDFGSTLEPKPTEYLIKKAAKKVTIKEIDNLAKLSKKNSGKAFRKEDYRELITDIGAVVDGTEEIFGTSQERTTCELLIASLPGKALAILGLKTIAGDTNSKTTRLVRAPKG